MTGMRSRRALKRRSKEGTMATLKNEDTTAEWMSGFRDELIRCGFGEDLVNQYVTEAFLAYVRDGGRILYALENADA